MLLLLGAYIKYKSKYIQCLFYLRLLMNLPMVSVPKAWVIDKQESFESKGKVHKMSDLIGGYYTNKKASMIVNRYRMLTSREYEHFNIRFHSSCSV